MLEAWLSEGEEIRIEKRGRPIGLLTAWRPDAQARPPKPDFAARRRAIWGSRVFSDAEVVDWSAVHQRAESLSHAHTLTTGHRLIDILHVATAQHFGVREFLTFDGNQKKLAEAEGLVVPV